MINTIKILLLSFLILCCSNQNKTFNVIKADKPFVTTLVKPINIDTELSFVSIVPLVFKNLIAKISNKIAKKKKGIAIKVTSRFIIFSKLTFILLSYFWWARGDSNPRPAD